MAYNTSTSTSTIDRTHTGTRLRRAAAGLAFLTCLTAAPAAAAATSGSPAATGTQVAAAPAAATTASSVRGDTVKRARTLLASRVRFQSTKGGVIRRSTPAGARNYLEYRGSNANRNEFNGYNGDAWCGWFAARVWTGVNRPSPSKYTKLPRYYQSSQAWRTDSDGRYRTFRRDRMPGLGDVVIWQDGPGRPGQVTRATTGHVGIVVAVNASRKAISTIEGNVNRDEINLRSYAWDADGPTMSGKHFLGHASRT